MNADSLPRCPWCHQPAGVVWVHGHGQCERCHTNVEPCCAGDECLPPDDSARGKAAS